MGQEQVILSQVGFTDRPPRSSCGLSRVIHSDDDQAGMWPLRAVAELTGEHEHEHRSFIRTVSLWSPAAVEGHDPWSSTYGTLVQALQRPPSVACGT